MLIFTHGYKLCNILNILLHSNLTCVTFFIDRENVPLQRADFEFFRKVLLPTTTALASSHPSLMLSNDTVADGNPR